MRRVPIAILAAGLLASACGTSQVEPAPPTQQQQTQSLTLGLETESPPPASAPPATTEQAAPTAAPQAGALLEIVVQAAARGSYELVWQSLSSQTQERLGPTLDDFQSGPGPAILEQLGGFAASGASYGVILALETAPGWAVAAIAGERPGEAGLQVGAFAAAFREEDGIYLLELGGPVQLLPVVPASITAGSQPPIAVSIAAPAPVDDAALWLDGSAVEAAAAGPDARHVSIGGPPASPLEAGPHVAVAYARAGDDATAIAFPFQAGQ